MKKYQFRIGREIITPKGAYLYFSIVRTLRQKKQLKQKDLAILLGLSVNSISAIENNEFLPSLSTILRLCHIFDCSPEELYRLEALT